MQEYQLLEPLFRQIKTGAFLTTKLGNKMNTMTISWMTIGRVWEVDLVTVYVRFSRYTYDFIENSDYFTISLPYPKDKLAELKLWGEKSGRDITKITTDNILSTKTVDGVIIKGCNIHIECQKIYDQVMDPRKLDKDLLTEFYDEKGDYHHIYYGKILEFYAEEQGIKIFPTD